MLCIYEHWWEEGSRDSSIQQDFLWSRAARRRTLLLCIGRGRGRLGAATPRKHSLTHKHMRQWYLNEHPIIPLAGKKQARSFLAPIHRTLLLLFLNKCMHLFYGPSVSCMHLYEPIVRMDMRAHIIHAAVDRKGDAGKGLSRCARPWKMRSAGQLECHAVMQALPLFNWISLIIQFTYFLIVIKTTLK